MTVGHPSCPSLIAYPCLIAYPPHRPSLDSYPQIRMMVDTKLEQLERRGVEEEPLAEGPWLRNPVVEESRG